MIHNYDHQMSHNQHPFFADKNRHPFFADNNRNAVFNKSGFFKELAGFSSVSTGKMVQCELCKNQVLFLHQYKRYEEKYCCIKCIDAAIKK